MRSLLLLVLVSSFFSVAHTAAAQTHSILNSPTKESLRGLSTPSATVFWASGTHGTYLRSLDGGKTWISAQVPGAEGLDFRDVEAFDADTAYLLSIGNGDQSRIYKTSDGGKNWSLQFTNEEPQGFFDCMAFWDVDHGIAVGDPVRGVVELITTKDGGKIWSSLPSASLPRAAEGENGSFAGSGTCITVQPPNHVWFITGGKVARVFHSADRGKNWQATDTPILHGNDSSGIFSVAFRDSKHGVIAGGDYKNPDRDGPNLAFTNDGGRTWQRAPVSPQWFFSAVAFDPGGKAILVSGATHSVWLQGDGEGKSWKKVWELNLNAVCFYTPGQAIAVGPEGLLVRFTGLD